MKRIPTSKPVGLPRFTYALIVCALIVGTIGVGSGIAADKNATPGRYERKEWHHSDSGSYTGSLQCVFLFGNGLFMLLAPSAWYHFVPGVIHTGSFNQHFIRDIGLIQMFLGAAFGVGMIRP